MRKQTHVWTDTAPRSTEDHKLFKTILIHESRHDKDKEEWGQKNLEWEGVIDSLTRLLQSGNASHISTLI